MRPIFASLCSLLVGAAAVCPAVTSVAAADSVDLDAVPQSTVRRVVIDGATGNPRIVELATALEKRVGATSVDRAIEALDNNRALLGLGDPERELVVEGLRTDALGGELVVFRQQHHGIPVFGATLRVHLDRDGAVRMINGAVVSDISVDPVPRIDAHQAEAIATRIVAKDVGGEPDEIDAAPARLLIYRTNLVRGRPGDNHLAWEVETASPPSHRELLYLDAHDGRLLDRRSVIHDLSRTIHLGSYPRPIWNEGDPLPYSSGDAVADAEVNELIDASGDAHAFFANLTGGTYLSYDGNDATMNAVYDSDSIDCPNAVESGGITAFCDGMVSDDVVAHEWAHAYTGWTHNLIYQWQPGALNEAYSDIFGELIDQQNQRGTDDSGEIRESDVCSAAGGSPRPTLTILTPPALAGPIPAGGAVFNPPASWEVTAPVELVEDGAGDPHDACQPIVGFSPGAIALIHRGTCYFRDKVLNAQSVGAAGVIVVNNQGDDIIEMGGDLPRLDIPAVFVGASDGDRIKTALADGVSATLALVGDFSDSVRWLIGEDTGALGAIRDMWMPACFGDPPRVGSVSYYCRSDDNGGVHSNSGIPNHAFALLVDGGVYNDRAVGAIGAIKAAHIYWRAMTVYQTPVTDFEDHADLLEQSCRDLIGHPLNDPADGSLSPAVVSADDCLQVAAAMAAVEMRDEPARCGFEPLLDPDAPPLTFNLVIFDEGFESDPGPRWTMRNSGVFPEYDPRDWVWTDDLPDGRDGAGVFAVDSVLIGDCQPGSDDQSGVMELEGPVIDIPHGVTYPVLIFEHWVATEPRWDGGNVKISVNDGPFLNVAPGRFLHNPYNDVINTDNTNPLEGEWAFTGTDEGSVDGSWGESRIALDGLVSGGDRLRIRFDFGVDGCNGVDGWYIDSVRVVATGAAARNGGRRVAP